MTNHLSKHAVAERLIFQPWPKGGAEGHAIALARAHYEAGTHEMAQRREGRFYVLYSIPRKRQARGREGYFTNRY